MTNRFDRAGAAFADLCRTMATLRGPQGCPWDREQTYATLKPYLVEEAYEVLEAMDSDPQAHRDELGDLLLQIVFQSEIAFGRGDFDAESVVQSIDTKLKRRHPHVFGDAMADSADAVARSWEAIKAEERGPDGSALDGIPKALPALLRASRCGEKAAALGFDWPAIDGALDKVEEEWREVRDAVAHAAAQAVAEEMGDLLFSMVNVCRHLQLDAEEALRQATAKFERRFRHVERHIRATGSSQTDLDALEEVWEDAKNLEQAKPTGRPQRPK